MYIPVGTKVSSGGSISIEYYNCLLLQTTPTETGLYTPAAKEIEISSFYNGPLAVMGVEFTTPFAPVPDILTIAMTQNATIQNGNLAVVHNVTLTGRNAVFFNGTIYNASITLTDTVKNMSALDSVIT